MSEHTESTSVGMHTLTLGLVVSDGAQAIDFYKRAFGAEELMRMPGPGGHGIMHAELKIGDTIFFLNDEFSEMGPRSPQTLGGVTSSIYLSVPDVDSSFKRAVDAGATEEMAIEDMFWGDRMGSVVDPFGHHWALATHTEDVSTEEMQRRAQDFFAQMGDGEGCDARPSV